MTRSRSSGASYSVRYGARDPFLAPFPNKIVYALWRLLIAVLRPAIFLVLLTGAAVFGWRTVEGAPMSMQRPDLAERVDAAFAASTRAPYADWVAMMEDALAPSRAAPDLALARSVAASYPALAGREALALEILGETGVRRKLIEADLRALPAWRRERALREVIEARLDEGDRAGHDPAALIFAPARIHTRLDRSGRLYRAAARDAEAWFVEPGDRALVLAATPGLDGPGVMFGDVRDLVLQGCALARTSRTEVAGCAAAPPTDSDPARAVLALLAAGLDGEAQIGARILKAAAFTGEADAAFLERLLLGRDATLGREAMLAASMPVLTEARDAHTQPARHEAAAALAAGEYQRAVRVREREAVLLALSEVRRNEGAVAAVRAATLLRRPEDAEALAEISRVTEGRLRALIELQGADVFGLARAPDLPRRAAAPDREAMIALALLGAAFAFVLWVLIAGLIRSRGGAPGLFERVDASATRLILGRNI
ncbi:MAG: hypothetical protein ABL308_12020 [Oceanicaulis sp.]